MGRLLSLVMAVGLLLSGGAAATLVKKGDGKSTGAATGGVDVGVPSGNKVRIQCWQDGRKIIDEADLAIVSLSIASQLNGLHFRRSTGTDGSLSVVAQARTTCLLGKHD